MARRLTPEELEQLVVDVAAEFNLFFEQEDGDHIPLRSDPDKVTEVATWLSTRSPLV